MTTDGATAKAHEVGRKADNSTALDHAVRLGLLSYGLVHLLIAWLAAQLALGDPEGQASKSGALQELAQKPFGELLMWVVGLGFAALVVWQLIEAALGHRTDSGLRRTGKRIASLVRVGIYGSLGFSAIKTAASGSSGSENTDPLTARLMSLPAGQVLVALVGLAIVGYAVHNFHNGLTAAFEEDLTGRGVGGDSGTAVVTLGRIGYVARGVAFLIVGSLFVWAAWTHDPDKSGGLDQALQTVRHQPFGPALLLAVAAGIGCFGVYCFFWARHLDR